MKKSNIFWIILTVLIGVVVLFAIYKLIFTKDSVNQGKFRVSDALLTSSAEIENKNSVNNAWSMDISQKNKLVLLINAATGSEVNKIVLKDITSSNENVVLYQEESENKLKVSENNNLDIEYTFDENNQFVIELNILNENILKNWMVPEDLHEIIYDGRIFKTAGIDINNLQFKLSFKLCIIEASGKENEMKVSLNLPSDELITNGVCIRRLPLTEFKFKVI